jgi:hypothetical protein
VPVGKAVPTKPEKCIDDAIEARTPLRSFLGGTPSDKDAPLYKRTQ